jgi:antitoxin Phd
MGKYDKIWPLQEAKARFSELVKRAQHEGPQTVSVRGEPAVVIVSMEEAKKLLPSKSAWEAMRGPGPYFDLEIPERPEEGTFRDVDLP